MACWIVWWCGWFFLCLVSRQTDRSLLGARQHRVDDVDKSGATLVTRASCFTNCVTSVRGGCRSRGSYDLLLGARLAQHRRSRAPPSPEPRARRAGGLLPEALHRPDRCHRGRDAGRVRLYGGGGFRTSRRAPTSTEPDRGCLS